MATPSTNRPAPRPPFLRLPVEIRLEIYALLLCTRPSRTLQIRTANPSTSPHPICTLQRRTTYHYIKDRMRSRSAISTYHLRPEWRQPQAQTIIHTAILQTNKQVHKEATHALYATHAFDFGLDVEAIVPFLSDLTPQGRRCVRSISFAKRALPHTKDFDRCEWAGACRYIAEELSWSLVSLHLDVYGGCPASAAVAGRLATDDIDVVEAWEQQLQQQGSFSAEDFAAMARCETEEMEWARQLAAVRGLKGVTVRAVMEHCPAPESSAMAFFVGFSRSIEGGFGEWLRGVMVKEEEGYGRAEGEGEQEKVEGRGRGWGFDVLR